MSALLRLAATSALAIALASNVRLWEADTFTIVLADGVTTFNFTSWPVNLVVSGTTYLSGPPFLEAKSWNVSNTMAVPELSLTVKAPNVAFNGGAPLMVQLQNGLFDGATVSHSEVYMETPGATAALGAVPIFAGVVAGIDIGIVTATVDVRGKSDLLDQLAPRNIFQTTCLHAFCDPGCTLSRASFTASFTVGSSGLTSSFIPWASAPGNATNYQRGTITMTSGAASGQTADIGQATTLGLTLNYPFYETPAPGDTFTAFQGCSKNQSDGSGQSCADYNNVQNFRAFRDIPPPNSAY